MENPEVSLEKKKTQKALWRKRQWTEPAPEISSNDFTQWGHGEMSYRALWNGCQAIISSGWWTWRYSIWYLLCCPPTSTHVMWLTQTHTHMYASRHSMCTCTCKYAYTHACALAHAHTGTHTYTFFKRCFTFPEALVMWCFLATDTKSQVPLRAPAPWYKIEMRRLFRNGGLPAEYNSPLLLSDAWSILLNVGNELLLWKY